MKLLRLPSFVRRSIIFVLLPVTVGLLTSILILFSYFSPSVFYLAISLLLPRMLFSVYRVIAMIAWYLFMECLGLLAAA